MILASLAGGMILAAAGAAPAAASPRVCVYAQERNIHKEAYTGHAFVQLLPDSGPQAGSRNLTFGFSPKEPLKAVTGGPGQILNDSMHRWDWKLCKSVTNEGYDKAVRAISVDRDKRPEYALLKFNCTDWAFKIAKEAGVNDLPSAKALGTGVLDPEALAKNYEKLWIEQGRRNIPRATGVWKNTANVFPNNLEDPPSGVIDLSSYTDIALLAFSDPHLIAHWLDMTPRTAVLPAETVGVGRSLRISLRGFGTLPTVTEVQFGDGSRQYQRRTFTHSYPRAGNHSVRGIAIANATVYRFTLRVTVHRGAGALTTATTVPKGARHHYQFPEPAPVVWPLPLNSRDATLTERARPGRTLLRSRGVIRPQE